MLYEKRMDENKWIEQRLHLSQQHYTNDANVTFLAVNCMLCFYKVLSSGKLSEVYPGTLCTIFATSCDS